MLGQGEGVTESNLFAPCDYEATAETFIEELFLARELVMAITSEGELFVIGGQETLPKK